MLITHKFRLCPSGKQEKKLSETLDLCRQTYNILLEELNNQKVIDKAQIQGIIPDIKICEPKFKKIYSKTAQYESYRLFSNVKALNKLKKNKQKVGRLRFKGKGWFKTFTYNQSGFKLIKTGKRYNRLHLSKIGTIQIRCHRNIKGKIKQITIKKEPSGKWYASIIEERKEKIKPKPIKKVIGIDLGLTDIVYDSDGNKITNPKHLKKHSDKLTKLQRKMSKKNKRSKNRNKARIKLTKQYEKLTNSRNDFLHKLSKYYVDNYDAIGIEDMRISNMVHSNFAKHILDAGWGRLRQLISYKAERAGKRLVLVNYKGTTQRCSQCGEEVPKELWERMHKCPYCGFIAPRDHNSALEIKKLALKKIGIGQDVPEFTPADDRVRPSFLKAVIGETGTICQNHSKVLAGSPACEPKANKLPHKATL